MERTRAHFLLNGHQGGPVKPSKETGSFFIIDSRVKALQKSGSLTFCASHKEVMMERFTKIPTYKSSRTSTDYTGRPTILYQHTAMSQQLLEQFLRKFPLQLQYCGCLKVDNLPDPTLRNEILPMFALDRWVKGHDQHTKDIYARMVPALRLASLLISEDCVLGWFHHLTLGRLREDRSSKPTRLVVTSTDAENSRSDQEETRDNLRRLGEIVSLMFVPSRHHDNKIVFGVTYTKQRMPWFSQYHPNDWPPVPSKYKSGQYRHFGQPAIALTFDFQRFFLYQLPNASKEEAYRTMFLFAETLVHEVAHAYWLWIAQYTHRMKCLDEPLWDSKEKDAELGFSWEANVLGRVINPVWPGVGSFAKVVMLCAVRSAEYAHDRDRQRALKDVCLHQKGLKLVRIYDWFPHGTRVHPVEFRGDAWYCGDGSPADVNHVSVIEAIPLKWIVDWFSEAEWSERRRVWRQRGTYTPPPLVKSFWLIYERDVDGYDSLHMPEDQQLEWYQGQPRHGDLTNSRDQQVHGNQNDYYYPGGRDYDYGGYY
ncbi:hypothetical protein BDV95DRAFT_569569 [Massariosphaeria phaeospora]|uniref:Uncharacterized protein n=1 Tax=Massariosphaeria phaeospora TaxID=100035 RepID=A0A7C8M9E1_9PLEO|nr:hypothetical protein BDV95DRAFT_569569 [Massariosphaeria phaeospora]